MSPHHRTFQRDFNDQFTEAVAKWKDAYDALYHLRYDFVWDDSERDVLKALDQASTFMLSTKTQLKKVARLRAETSISEQQPNPQPVVT